MLPDDRVARVLVITAHPDDVDFGAAGTVAHWTDAGIDVTYCVVTDGDAGGHDPAVPRDAMAALRREEQTKAAAIVGVTDLVFLGYPDGRLVASLELRRDLARVIRAARPDRVVCQSPERNYEFIYPSHPDHLAAGEAAISAVYPDARNPFAFPELLEEGYEPHTVSEVWFMSHRETHHFVDVTDTFERKLEALRAHASQITDPEGLHTRIHGWLTANASRAGLPDGRLAEAFWVMHTQ